MTSLTLIVVALACLACVSGATTNSDKAVKKAFENFKHKYGRNYTNALEEHKRLLIFADNLRRAAKQQKMNPAAVFGVTQFSDLTPEEFKAKYLGDFSALQKKRDENPVAGIFSEAELKGRSGGIDWRDYGAVTYVKNQQNCGGCWSFSSTGSIEGQWVIAGHQALVALSEQNLLSCDTTDSGCNGGIMDNAWGWLINNQGGSIATEATDPFVSGNGQVPACSTAGVSWGATITSYQDLPQNEQQMASWMDNNGPISIAVDATSFQSYNGGIITDCISQQLDHAVLAVGYNDQSSPPYWIIKNSWGAGWGEAGYVYVEMYANECLIANAPCTSVVGSGNDWHAKKRPPLVKRK